MKKNAVFLLALLLATNLTYSQNDSICPIELRGVWISTVKMLDYPSARGLSSGQLKSEYIKILDSLKKIHINSIFFQIRPAADAFFYSPYEPWSEWLTGKQGRPPEPYFDPLKFYIEEAHKRGMEFHAWINPFRAIATIEYADVVPWHITRQKPEWFFVYGKHKYFNPGIPEVRDYIVKIIADVARRYNVDGIHFDDYFYPYPERNDKGKIIPVPDWKTYKKYGKGFKNIKDWRRYNITSFIEQVHDTLKNIDSQIVFGISPCAVWRNKRYDPRGSNTRGLAAYDWLYADILLWDSLKLVDYIAPQLYFYTGHKYADYKTLVRWWAQNIKNSYLFIGLNIQALVNPNDKHWKNPSEIPDQIRLARTYPKIQGFILYRSKSVLSNPQGIYDSLRNDLFADTTRTPWQKEFKTARKQADTIPPATPAITDYYFIKDTLFIVWDINDESKIINDETPAYYKIYITGKSKKDSLDLVFRSIQKLLKIEIDKGSFLTRRTKYFISVSAVDSSGNESNKSKPAVIKLKAIKSGK